MFHRHKSWGNWGPFSSCNGSRHQCKTPSNQQTLSQTHSRKIKSTVWTSQWKFILELNSLGIKYQMEIMKDIDVSQTWFLSSRILLQPIEGRQKCKHLEHKMVNAEIKVKETRPGNLSTMTLQRNSHKCWKSTSQKRSMLSPCHLSSLRSHLTP